MISPPYGDAVLWNFMPKKKKSFFIMFFKRMHMTSNFRKFSDYMNIIKSFFWILLSKVSNKLESRNSICMQKCGNLEWMRNFIWKLLFFLFELGRIWMHAYAYQFEIMYEMRFPLWMMKLKKYIIIICLYVVIYTQNIDTESKIPENICKI